MARLILLLSWLLAFGVSAADLTQLSEKASEDARRLEPEQLEKARAAAKETAEREQKVLKRQQSGDWQEEQRLKASKQFDERAQREQKYLQEAKEAAAKERKIEEPKMKKLKQKKIKP